MDCRVFAGLSEKTQSFQQIDRDRLDGFLRHLAIKTEAAGQRQRGDFASLIFSYRRLQAGIARDARALTHKNVKAALRRPLGRRIASSPPAPKPGISRQFGAFPRAAEKVKKASSHTAASHPAYHSRTRKCAG